jgi:hypothetical protein
MTGILHPCIVTLTCRHGMYAWACSCGSSAKKWRDSERAAGRNARQHAKRAPSPRRHLGRINRADRSLSMQMLSRGWPVTSKCRVAARYAHLSGTSITEAAHTLDVNPGGVWNAWERMYPTEEQPRTYDLSGAEAVRQWRRRHAGGETMASIARSVSVPYETARQAIKGITWKGLS